MDYVLGVMQGELDGQRSGSKGIFFILSCIDDAPDTVSRAWCLTIK